jgi:hypothetical protein
MYRVLSNINCRKEYTYCVCFECCEIFINDTLMSNLVCPNVHVPFMGSVGMAEFKTEDDAIYAVDKWKNYH